MNKFRIQSLAIFLVSLFFINTFNACDFSEKRQNKKDLKSVVDISKIKKRGKLIVITDFNSIDYFIYRGQPLGYHYELIKQFAESIGVELEIKISHNLETTFEALNNRDCDIIAMGLTVTKERKKIMQFTKPLLRTRQVLVQRKPKDWHKFSRKQLEDTLIRSALELINKKIVVEKNSAFCDRLRSLSDEIGDTIEFIGDDEHLTDELIKKVSEGEIDYTISDEHVAMVNQTYYNNIDIKMPISFEQNIAWAVRKESKNLLAEINKWLVDYKSDRKYVWIYNKYFKNSRTRQIANSEYNSAQGGRISVFDDLLKQKSDIVGWDWRLLASLVYTESRFNTTAESWAGAYGLMQLMPVTASRFGVTKESPPSANIIAGIKYLKWLDKYYQDIIPDSAERVKFVLASYNAGAGHVEDARTLAEKNGKNPNLWKDNVDFYILNKSNPKYYNDPDVKYGYCRGTEPYRYVNEILERYENYKNLIQI